MKFSAKWFLNGKEVELPEMKIEGSLAVAELMKSHVDEFLPFVVAMQTEATLRLRVSVLSEIQTAGDKVSDDQKTQLKTICRVYNVPYSDGNIQAISSELLGKIVAELTDSAQKSAKAQITSAPFFIQRSLIEAYYMLKAYIYDEARKNGSVPKMPFNFDDFKTIIDENETAQFTKHVFEKMKEAPANEPSLESIDEEELKKKLQTAQMTS